MMTPGLPPAKRRAGCLSGARPLCEHGGRRSCAGCVSGFQEGDPGAVGDHGGTLDAAVAVRVASVAVRCADRGKELIRVPAAGNAGAGSSGTVTDPHVRTPTKDGELGLPGCTRNSGQGEAGDSDGGAGQGLLATDLLVVEARVLASLPAPNSPSRRRRPGATVALEFAVRSAQVHRCRTGGGCNGATLPARVLVVDPMVSLACLGSGSNPGVLPWGEGSARPGPLLSIRIST